MSRSRGAHRSASPDLEVSTTAKSLPAASGGTGRMYVALPGTPGEPSAEHARTPGTSSAAHRRGGARGAWPRAPNTPAAASHTAPSTTPAPRMLACLLPRSHPVTGRASAAITGTGPPRQPPGGVRPVWPEPRGVAGGPGRCGARQRAGVGGSQGGQRGVAGPGFWRALQRCTGVPPSGPARFGAHAPSHRPAPGACSQTNRRAGPEPGWAGPERGLIPYLGVQPY